MPGAPNLESVSVHPVYGNPRTGLLRTFWEPDRVLRSPLRGFLCLGCPHLPYKKSVSVHPVHGNPRTGLLRTFLKPHRVLRRLPVPGFLCTGCCPKLPFEKCCSCQALGNFREETVLREDWPEIWKLLDFLFKDLHSPLEFF